MPHNNKAIRFVGLTIAAAFLVLAVSFATRSIIGLGMAQWARDLGWSKSEMSAVGALALCIMALVVCISGYAADRWGARRVLVLGCAALAIAVGSMAWMEQIWQFALGYGIFGGLGFGLVSLPVAGSLIVRRVQRRQGLATGIATSGATAGQLLILPSMAAAFPLLGWRGSFAGFALACVAVAVIAYIAIGPEPAHEVEGPAEQSGGLLARIGAIVRKPAFHGLFWSFTLCGFTSTGVVETHLIPFAEFCGFPPLPSSIAYGVFAVFNLVGMLGSGYLSDRVDRRNLLICIYLLRSVAFIIPLYVGMNYSLLVAFTVVVGIAFYATFPATIGLSAAHFGVQNIGLVMGIMTVGHAFGAAAGAYLSGYIFDLFLHYDWAWLLSMTLAASAAIFISLSPDPRARRDSACIPAGLPPTAPDGKGAGAA